VTTQEAKKILTLYRPGSVDAKDPEFSEALLFARQDAELKGWLDEHYAVQSDIRERFKGIAVPEGLKEQIISEYKSRTAVVWWRQPVLLAAAAVIIVMIAGGLKMLPSKQDKLEASFQGFRILVVREVQRNYGMSLESSSDAEIKKHLASRQSPSDYKMPAALANKPLVGCNVIGWRHANASMICFRTGKPLPAGKKSDLFLFVVDRHSVNGAPELSPQFAQVKNLATASWSDGDKTYLLATPGSQEDLRPYL
jgi:uncharacterized membrane protein YbaN (DUF454 family)